jgi:hypothetical protein
MKKGLIVKVLNGSVTVNITVCCMVLGIMLDNCNSFDFIVIIVVINKGNPRNASNSFYLLFWLFLYSYRNIGKLSLIPLI